MVITTDAPQETEKVYEIFSVGSKWAWANHGNPRHAPQVWFEIGGFRWLSTNLSESGRDRYVFELEHILLIYNHPVPAAFEPLLYSSWSVREDWLMQQRLEGNLIPL